VYHGLPEALYPFRPRPGSYLAFLGRIAPEKRPDRAIEIAKRAGLPLKIAAKIDPADAAYFAHDIEPLLDHPLIEFIGEIDDRHKAEFLGNAMALLFPIDWPEPFGLVMIEAMCTGTPVIAWRHGSVPEIVDNGVTGYIVDSIEAAVLATKQVSRLDRAAVRWRFLERFSATRMTYDYIELYETLLARNATDDATKASYHLPAKERHRSAETPPSTTEQSSTV
jgi:glycosyltransferase involved in cell wall biosynthesis